MGKETARAYIKILFCHIIIPFPQFSTPPPPPFIILCNTANILFHSKKYYNAIHRKRERRFYFQ